MQDVEYVVSDSLSVSLGRDEQLAVGRTSPIARCQTEESVPRFGREENEMYCDGPKE